MAARSSAIATLLLLSPLSAIAVDFTTVVVDPGNAGDCKAVADIDGDGQPDLIIGGMPDEGLSWYRFPSWTKTIIATPTNEFTTDCDTGDVDGDGDIDIVAPDGNSGNNVVWFRNPAQGGGDPGVGSQWSRHAIGATGSWTKDVDLADFDADGRLDVATRIDTEVVVFFGAATNSWVKVVLDAVSIGLEGMTSGDIDGDGDIDLVIRGAWLANPAGSAARTPDGWNEYAVGAAPTEFKALVTDLDGNGRADIVFSSSEGTADVIWWAAAGGDPRGAWTGHTVVASLERAHTLQAADMDKDGDTDLVVGQMHTSSQRRLALYLNDDARGTRWTTETVNQGAGLHNGVVADIGRDGDFDIFGANWTGTPPVHLWVNEGAPTSIQQWTHIDVSSTNTQTFGLACGDVDGDLRTDIVTGRHWFKNPDVGTSTWSRSDLPDGMHGILFTDIDGDTNADVIAQRDLNGISMYWLERQGSSWTQVLVGTLPAASHALGTQGYAMAQVVNGGKPELVLSSGDGIYYFRIPASPASGNWPRTQVNSNPSDEGFGVGDIDGDGHPDIAATTGDSKRVEWYRNPGNGGAGWEAFPIGSFSEALYPDRTALGDFNGDGRLDIVVSEENGEATGAETYWWEQPLDPQSSSWARHLLTSQGTTNSLHVADMDNDGDPDVVTGEHRGQLRVQIWQNSGTGAFTAQTVDTGRESHLGVLPCDLDRNGNLDLVSIAYDDFGRVSAWINSAGDSSPEPLVPRPPTNLTAE